MKAILQVGYTQILLPNIEDASRAMKILSKGALCRDRLYDKKVTIEDRELDLELKLVPDGTRFVGEAKTESDEEVSISPLTPHRPKASKNRKSLANPNTLLLEFPKSA